MTAQPKRPNMDNTIIVDRGWLDSLIRKNHALTKDLKSWKDLATDQQNELRRAEKLLDDLIEDRDALVERLVEETGIDEKELMLELELRGGFDE